MFREEARGKCIEQWRTEWTNSEKGQWTQTLLLTIELEDADGVADGARAPDFWLSQGLSGHGVFALYLYKYKRRRSPRCRCGAGEETPDHVFNHCLMYAVDRPAKLDGRS